MTQSATMKHVPSLNRSAAIALRRQRDGRSVPNSKNRPMSEMNVTPFIDVLLVLLIMMIIAIPVAWQKTSVGLPSTGCADCTLQSDFNTVSITDADQLLWNGAPITRERLSASIALASTLEEPPVLRFNASPAASYDVSAKTIALIKHSGGEKMAFDGLAPNRNFGR